MWGVFERDSVRAQVKAILDEIERLEGSEFPYAHSKEALDQLRGLFTGYSTSLSRLADDLDQSVVDHTCNQSFKSASESLEVLGFILRSTNVRNAFEMYGPFLRLAQKILGPDTKLLMSSEWSYSPFTYVGYEHLPGFVLIGLPATESSNPFLLPLAGHELGHSLWDASQFAPKFEPLVAGRVIKLIKSKLYDFRALFPDPAQESLDVELRWTDQPWTPAWRWAIKQCEELFCDFVGLRVFGESYLWASAYLMAPLKTGKRSFNYPNNASRAAAMVKVAKEYSLTPPPAFEVMFNNLEEPSEDQRPTNFLLSIADAAREETYWDLAGEVNRIVSEAGVSQRQPDIVNRCMETFRFMAPAQQSGGLANLLNAAWEAARKPDFFFDSAYNGTEKTSHLKEIVLKSIEVLEYDTKLARM